MSDDLRAKRIGALIAAYEKHAAVQMTGEASAKHPWGTYKEWLAGEALDASDAALRDAGYVIVPKP